MRFTRIILALATSLAISTTVAVDTAHAAPTKKSWSACATEDGEWTGTRCVWLATSHGNGTGSSFYVNKSGAHKISHDRAKVMLSR